jgi:hypothetical protein
VAGLNVYSDGDRYLLCDPNIPASDKEGQSKVYDMALILIIAYHIIEWVRMIVFLVTLVLGANLLHIWYASALNVIYGLAIYIYIHVIRFSETGKWCADS